MIDEFPHRHARPDVNTDSFMLNCGGRLLDCRPLPHARPIVMGILNVTPDSFSDGGVFQHPDAALHRMEEMLEEGAEIIDVGGESTRPGGVTYGRGGIAVGAEEESRRVIPVIESGRKRFPEAVISIDTYRADVARRAVEAGATMLNDITGLRMDSSIARVAAQYDLPLVLMHSVGTPGALHHEGAYADVVDEVAALLRQSVETATEHGARQLVLDPGFGFGKSVHENLKLIAHVDTLLRLNYPVLVGISRKSTIGRVLGGGEEARPVEERLYGTLGATAVAIIKGASIIRTHDVRPTVEMLKLMHAVETAGIDTETRK